MIATGYLIFIEKFRALDGSYYYMDGGQRISDVDGDGFPDLIRAFTEDGDDETNEIYSVSNGTWVKVSDDSFPLFYEDIYNRWGTLLREDFGVLAIDVNGDTLADVLKSQEGEPKISYINSGNYTWTQKNSWNLPNYIVYGDGSDPGYRFLDINADGLVDFILFKYEVSKVYLNTGSGWQENTDWYLDNTVRTTDISERDMGVRFLDMNADGLPDIVEHSPSAQKTFISKGEYFSRNDSYNPPNEAQFVGEELKSTGVKLFDLTSDGAVDLVRWGGVNGSKEKYIWKNKAYKPYLLTSIQSRAGGISTFEYSPSSIVNNTNLNHYHWLVTKKATQSSHQEMNGYLDCEPQTCNASEELDSGVECLGSNCQRTCIKTSCGSFASFYNESESWGSQNYSDSQIKDASQFILTGYDNFSENYCYNVTVWSDNDIVFSDNIQQEGGANTVAAMALYSAMGPNAHPWNGYCEPDDSSAMLDYRKKYLIDSKGTQSSYQSGDQLGGAWEWSCRPDTFKCFDLLNCTTSCYDYDYTFRYLFNPRTREAYQERDPGNIHGACNVIEDPYSEAITAFIDYKPEKQYGINISRAPVIYTYNNYTCQRSSATITEYAYNYGYFDYDKDEFRGYAIVKTIVPNRSITINHYHQDEPRQGLVYSTEYYDSNNNLLKIDEYNYSVKESDYQIVELDYTQEKLYDGLDYAYSTKTVYDYDLFGNVNYTHLLGDVSLSNDDRYLIKEFIVNEDKWLVVPLKTVLKDYVNSTVNLTNYSYDGQAYQSIPVYGLLTSRQRYNDQGVELVETFDYDLSGNMNQSTNPRGFISSYVYDSTGTFVVLETNPEDQSTSYVYDLGTGNLLNSTDQNGFVTNYFYDEFGRIVKEVEEYDSETYPTVETVYDEDGVFPEYTTTKTKDSVNNGYYQTTRVFDGYNNLVQERKEANNGLVIIVDKFYDSAGNIDEESYPYFGSGFTYTAPSQNVYSIKNLYDALNRLIKTTYPDATTTEIIFAHKNRTITDRNNNEKKQLFDAYDRIIEVDEFLDSTSIVTVYEYDAFGNLVRIEDDEGNIWTYQFDSLNRLIQENDPDTGTAYYSYDENGNLINETFETQSYLYDYDSLDRVLWENSSQTSIEYEYDLWLDGTLSKISEEGLEQSFDYDKRYRTTSENKTIDGITFSSYWTYDPMDRTLTHTQPNGETITYDYSDQGQLESIPEIINQIDYDEFDQQTNKSYANGLRTEYEYDSLTKRLMMIKTGSLQELRYEYDNESNVLEIDDVAHNNITSLIYDDLYRLTSAEKQGIFDLEYSYDVLGNMLFVSGDGDNYTFNYSEGPHAPSSVSISRTGVIA